MDEACWHQILEEFNDANIYQTWSYDEVRGGRDNISHVVLKKDGEVVAAAQARIVKLPLIGAGIAYVRWGPLWRRRSLEPDADLFRQAIRALRNEYACKRGLVLRLRPVLFREVSSDFASILAEEGYSAGDGAPDRTLRLDLTKTAEELRKGMRPHWRRYLEVAEKSDLEIVEGSADALFEEFITIYRELVSRKGVYRAQRHPRIPIDSGAIAAKSQNEDPTLQGGRQAVRRPNLQRDWRHGDLLVWGHEQRRPEELEGRIFCTGSLSNG